MKQDIAQSIINEALQLQGITAALDDAHAKRYTNGGGYRVRVTHQKLRRSFTIWSQEEWASIKMVWDIAS